MFSQTEGQGGAINNGNDGFAVTQTMVTTLDGGITVANRIGNPYWLMLAWYTRFTLRVPM